MSHPFTVTPIFMFFATYFLMTLATSRVPQWSDPAVPMRSAGSVTSVGTAS